MLDNLIPLIAILSFGALPIVLVSYILILFIKTRHTERLETLKLGIPLPQSNTQPDPNRYAGLRNGFLCLGLGIGLAVGIWYQTEMQLKDAESFFSIIAFMFGGLGLAYIVFFFVSKKREQQLNGENE